MKLKNIALVKAGNSAPNKDTFTSSGIPFVRAGSLEFLVRNESIDNCEKIGEAEAKSLKLKLFPRGSILFAKSGMSAKMGRVYQLPSDAFIVSHLAVIIPDESIISSGYLKYYFIGKPPMYLIRDEAYPSIRLSDIEEIEIDLPDLETQNKIVAILDKASALVQKRQRSIDLLDELLRAQFLEMFGKLINTSNETMQLNDLVKKGDRINYGIVQPGNHDSNGIPVIRVGDFEGTSINHNNLLKVKPEISNKHRNSILQGGELLIACVGATIGKIALVDDKCSGFNIVRATARINCGDEIVNTYLLNLLETDFYQDLLQRLARTVAQPTLNIKQISEIEVPVPSKSEQLQFDNIYQKYKGFVASQKESFSQLNALQGSLMQQAFSGKLHLDVSVELDALLEEIDLQKSENDLFSIITNEEYLLSLVNRLNNQEFESQDLYDRAKHVAFQLLKAEERLAQEYDEQSKNLKLVVK